MRSSDAGLPGRVLHTSEHEPAGLVGPTVYGMGDLVRGYLRATGKRRPMLPVRMPGKVGRSYRAGENLNLNGADHGHRTWEAFLTTRI